MFPWSRISVSFHLERNVTISLLIPFGHLGKIYLQNGRAWVLIQCFNFFCPPKIQAQIPSVFCSQWAKRITPFKNTSFWIILTLKKFEKSHFLDYQHLQINVNWQDNSPVPQTSATYWGKPQSTIAFKKKNQHSFLKQKSFQQTSNNRILPPSLYFMCLSK